MIQISGFYAIMLENGDVVETEPAWAGLPRHEEIALLEHCVRFCRSCRASQASVLKSSFYVMLQDRGNLLNFIERRKKDNRPLSRDDAYATVLQLCRVRY